MVKEFVLFKLKTSCTEAGVMSYLRTIKAVYKEAQRRTSLNIKSHNPFLGIIKTTKTKPIIKLQPEELKKLDAFIPHKFTSAKALKHMKQIRDIFLFQLLIGGHDFIDIALLKWDNIKDNRINFQRYKLRNRTNGGAIIDNKRHKKALQIINKHGDLKDERIFSFIPNPIIQQKAYIFFRGNANRTLQSISKSLGYKNALKTKSPRYLFRTYAGELLIHDLIVMKLQGHTPKGVTFNYQGAISYKVIDEMNLKIHFFQLY